MFMDPEKNSLYTITFGDSEDRKAVLQEKLDAAENDHKRELI